MKGKIALLILFQLLCFVSIIRAQSWTADNGNGTYTNPLERWDSV